MKFIRLYPLISTALFAILVSAIAIYLSDLIAKNLDSSSDLLKTLIVSFTTTSISILISQIIVTKHTLRDLARLSLILFTIVLTAAYEALNSNNNFQILLLTSIVAGTIVGLVLGIEEEIIELDEANTTPLDKTTLIKLAELERKVTEEDIFVIGVAGPWGIGKTRLITEFVNGYCKANRYKVTCVDSSNYFSSESLISRLKERYMHIFFSDNPNLFAKAAFSSLISAAPTFLSSLINHFFSPVDELKVKEMIRRHIQKSRQNYLIVYDDLDRLSSAEVLVALRLIEKLNRIPNIKQIVLYDRNRIEKILAQSGPGINSFLSKYIDFELPCHALAPSVANPLAATFIKKALEGCPDSIINLHGETVYSENFLYLLSNYRDQIQFYYNLKTLLNFAGTQLNLDDAISISILKTSFPVIYQDLFNEIPSNHDSFIAAYDADYGNLAEHAYKLIESLTSTNLSMRLFRFQNMAYRPLYQMEAIYLDSISLLEVRNLQRELAFISDFNFEDTIPLRQLSGVIMRKFTSNIEGITAELMEKELSPFITLLFSHYSMVEDLTPADLFNFIKHLADKDILKKWLRSFLESRAERSYPEEIREVIAAYYCLSKIYKSSHSSVVSSLRESVNTYLGNCSPLQVLSCSAMDIETIFEDGEFIEDTIDHINALPNSIKSLDKVAIENLLYTVLTIEDLGFFATVKDPEIFKKLSNTSKQLLIERLETLNNLELINSIEILRDDLTSRSE